LSGWELFDFEGSRLDLSPWWRALFSLFLFLPFMQERVLGVLVPWRRGGVSALHRCHLFLRARVFGVTGIVDVYIGRSLFSCIQGTDEFEWSFWQPKKIGKREKNPDLGLGWDGIGF
jgi:hypothetical protein